MRKRVNEWISKYGGYFQHFLWHCVCFLAVMYFFWGGGWGTDSFFFKSWLAWLFTCPYVCHRWKVLHVIYAAEYQELGLQQTWCLVTEILSMELCYRFINESWFLHIQYIWRINHLDINYSGSCVVELVQRLLSWGNVVCFVWMSCCGMWDNEIVASKNEMLSATNEGHIK